MELDYKVKETIRDVYDFPKEGIVFRDITPLLENPTLTAEIAESLYLSAKEIGVDAVMGIESRGFLWGALLAQKLGVPFIPVRKKGKLPYKTISHKYKLEYGEAEIEVHEGVIKENQRILIHDDLLATGGTAAAAAHIVESQKAKVVGFSFIVVLEFLKGREVLRNFSENISEIVSY